MAASRATTAGVVRGTSTDVAHARLPASPVFAFSAARRAVVPEVASLLCGRRLRRRRHVPLRP
eukprot:6184419-Pleurochrysis_carterae.AAC.1